MKANSRVRKMKVRTYMMKKTKEEEEDEEEDEEEEWENDRTMRIELRRWWSGLCSRKPKPLN